MEYRVRDYRLRRINPVVTRVLTDLEENLAPLYGDIYCPSIGPALMRPKLTVRYCYWHPGPADYRYSRMFRPRCLAKTTRPKMIGFCNAVLFEAIAEGGLQFRFWQSYILHSRAEPLPAPDMFSAPLVPQAKLETSN